MTQLSELINGQDRLTAREIKRKYLEIFCISEESKSFALTPQHQPESILTVMGFRLQRSAGLAQSL